MGATYYDIKWIYPKCNGKSGDALSDAVTEKAMEYSDGLEERSTGIASDSMSL